MSVARVIVDVAARSLDRSFDYAIPVELAERVRVGVPALVDFAGRPAVAYVVEVSDCPSVEDVVLKPIMDVLGEPAFRENVATVAEWISKEYVCGLSEALRLFLPPGGTPRIQRIESESGHTYRLEPPRVKPQEVRWYRLRPDADATTLRPNAHRQRAVLDSLSEGWVSGPELSARLGDVSAPLRSLVEKGLLESVDRVHIREAMREAVARGGESHELNHAQREALSAFESLGAGETLLMHGVTGSGKTEVYLRAIEQVLKQDSSAIVLVPEISLTPQAVGRFRSRFGERVAVLHSALASGERFDQWQRVMHGEADVVIGPRSAIFAPVERLGVLIIDEEHDHAYKQGSAPRYHAEAVAERICALSGARLILGSATPSMESLELVHRGAAKRCVLPLRATGAAMPAIDVVDMTSEFAAGHKSMFSRPLLAALAVCFEERAKAIVLLNRRGHSSFLLCRECGHVPGCDSCSVSMTYHSNSQCLLCHHCGKTSNVPAVCPECGSPYLRQFGAGTQRVEEQLESHFPGISIVRMDADTTTRRGAHERLLAEFEGLATGVLLGTQMIAKGLDYPDVTLVGVVNADTMLHLPDFRAAERTYQLLEQVSGRSGRGDRPGRVILQTYWPEHPAIRAVAEQSPDILYDEEERCRRALGYPPYGRLARVVVSGRDPSTVSACARDIASAIEDIEAADVVVLGPSPAPIGRLRGRYRWHVLVKGLRSAPLPSLLAAAVGSVPRRQDVTVAPDVDPLDIL